jgi:vacuolar-type H+-ATPase subunit H
MKNIGYLLHETLEKEAHLSRLISQAKTDADNVINDAKAETAKIETAAREKSVNYKDNSLRKLADETASIKEKWKHQTAEDICTMSERFEHVVAELSRDIAERILRHESRD